MSSRKLRWGKCLFLALMCMVSAERASAVEVGGSDRKDRFKTVTHTDKSTCFNNIGATTAGSWKFVTKQGVTSVSSGWSVDSVTETSASASRSQPITEPEAFSVSLSGEMYIPGGQGGSPLPWRVQEQNCWFLIQDSKSGKRKDEVMILHNEDITFGAYRDLAGSSSARKSNWTVTPVSGGTAVSVKDVSSIKVGPNSDNQNLKLSPGKYTVHAEDADPTYMNPDSGVKEDLSDQSDSITLTIFKLSLKSVSFSGDNTINQDNGTGAYSAPHWVDNSNPLDGDADDSGDRKFPVCYVRNIKAKVSTVINVEAPPSGQIKVKADGGIEIPVTDATLSGSSITLPETEAKEKFVNTVAFLNPLTINWKVSFDDGATWYDAGKSENRVYITLSTPQSSYETVLDIGCRNAATKNTEQATADAIWSDFTDRDVKRKEKNGYNVTDNIQMKYWNPSTGIPQDVAGMLAASNGNGSCIAWSQLFNETLKGQGITSARICKITPKTGNGFLVKNWKFGKHIRTGANGINNTDTKSPSDDLTVIPKDNGAPKQKCISAGADDILSTTPSSDDEVSGKFITTGANGKCETTAFNDAQIIPNGNGVPDQVCISAGTDGILNTTPSGDDQVSGTSITTGANGKCETTSAGDDVQVIPNGNGVPGQVCISAGTDGNLSATPGGDDQVSGTSITTGPNGICETTAPDDLQMITINQGEPNELCILPGPDGVLDSTKEGDDTEQDGLLSGGTYPYILGLDAIDQNGIPGQGNSNPPGGFYSHFIVKYNGKYYDPSYGSGPFDTETAHENASIDGIFSNVSGGYAVGKKDDDNVQELDYN